jgi:hypothetical protein
VERCCCGVGRYSFVDGCCCVVSVCVYIRMWALSVRGYPFSVMLCYVMYMNSVSHSLDDCN